MFKTMLAGKADAAKLRLPVLASPKLDGVRAHIIGGQVVSRNMLPFRNPEIQERFGREEFEGLDGEFMVGVPTSPDAFRRTGVLNSLSGDTSQVRLHVFDDFRSPTTPFRERLGWAWERSVHFPNELKAVPHELIESHHDLELFEHKCLESGYEGVMLRDPDGPYKFGRSTVREGWLLKLKRFEDSEAEIVGYEEKMHNANDMTLMRGGKPVRNTRREGLVPTGVLGAVVVQDLKTGVEFSVGSGFNDAERSALWQHPEGLIGRIIKYQYFPVGGKVKPRFPTFKGFRDKGDI